MAAFEEITAGNAMIPSPRLRLLSWLPALMPLILLAGFGMTLLMARWLDSSGAHVAHDQSAAFGGALLALRGLFFLGFYVAAPLWCVMAVFPSLRPAPAGIFWQALLFSGGWFAFFVCAGKKPDLWGLFLGVG